MRLDPAWIFALVFAVAAIFIYRTVGALPPILAMHFNMQGNANGFARRDVYRRVQRFNCDFASHGETRMLHSVRRSESPS